MLERVRRALQLPSSLFLGLDEKRDGPQASGLLCANDPDARRSALLDRRPNRRARKLFGAICAPVAALLTGAPLGISDEGFPV